MTPMSRSISANIAGSPIGTIWHGPCSMPVQLRTPMHPNINHHLIRADRWDVHVLSPSPSDRTPHAPNHGLALDDLQMKITERPSRPTPGSWLCSNSSQADRCPEGARIQRGLQRDGEGAPSYLASKRVFRTCGEGGQSAMSTLHTRVTSPPFTSNSSPPCKAYSLRAPLVHAPRTKDPAMPSALGIRNVDATARTRGDRRRCTTVNGVRGNGQEIPDCGRDGKELGPVSKP